MLIDLVFQVLGVLLPPRIRNFMFFAASLLSSAFLLYWFAVDGGWHKAVAGMGFLGIALARGAMSARRGWGRRDAPSRGHSY
ncbi:hypothetical protein AB0N09_42685 [Streptomyces erythrochromogenes]|uniref:hypothetical protein n=1 Tax=Streptomyces erythrochromogenes TaxID=285574 RepID=UPI00344681B8